MKLDVLVAFVFCAGLVHSHPVGDSSFLDLGDDKPAPELAAVAAGTGGARSEDYGTDGSWESTVRKLRLKGLDVYSDRFDKVRPYSVAGRRLKRPFGESSGWSKFDVPDPYLNPIHLQNWSSQFGRNYRAFNGGGDHVSTGGLRPVSGGFYAGDGGAGVFGEDGLQDWRAFYHDGRF